MRRRVDTPSRIEYVAHSPGSAGVAALLGIATFFLAARATGAAALIAQGMGVVFGLAGLVAVFWQDSFHLDLAQRRWVRLRGFRPIAKKAEGSFDNLQRVEVVEDHGFRRGRPNVEWEVWLRASERAATLRLLETHDEAEARRTERELAARLVMK
jgi:hypothetical protein